MHFSESLAFYLVVGMAVAVAHLISERPAKASTRWLTAAATCVFWPLYLPLVLAGSQRPAGEPREETAKRDDLAAAIGQVEHELDAALRGLDGWAENVLERQPDRLRELRVALAAQAERIRDMERVLARDQAGAGCGSHAEPENERWQRSQQARRDNMIRLERLCARSRSDLLATLAWIRELVSMIHLARFTGAPAARAEELVGQIAAAVESISSLSPANAARDPPDLAGDVATPLAELPASGKGRSSQSFQGVLP